MLVVDDDSDIIAIARLGLRCSGHSVCGAKNVGEALTEIEKNKPDVVVTDLMLPGVSGIELVRIAYERGIPVYAMSGADYYEAPAREMGASGFIRKGSGVNIVHELERVVSGLKIPSVTVQAYPVAQLPTPEKVYG